MGPSSPALGFLAFERPSSPLCRVANPMVRDHHFRRGLGVARKRDDRTAKKNKGDGEAEEMEGDN